MNTSARRLSGFTLPTAMVDVALMVEGQSGLTWPRWQRICLAAETRCCEANKGHVQHIVPRVGQGQVLDIRPSGRAWRAEASVVLDMADFEAAVCPPPGECVTAE